MSMHYNRKKQQEASRFYVCPPFFSPLTLRYTESSRTTDINYKTKYKKLILPVNLKLWPVII